MVLMVMDKTGVAVRAMEIMYKTVVQTVVFYGRESWVITEEMMIVLHEIYIILNKI